MGKKERFYADIMSMHQEVTGSCNIVTVRLPYGEKFHFVVDCGLFQETEYMIVNCHSNQKILTFVWLHMHM